MFLKWVYPLHPQPHLRSALQKHKISIGEDSREVVPHVFGRAVDGGGWLGRRLSVAAKPLHVFARRRGGAPRAGALAHNKYRAGHALGGRLGRRLGGLDALAVLARGACTQRSAAVRPA